MKSAKFSNLHIYFFYLFLLSIPFQTRKVFLTEYSFYSGAFTEYATFFIYASDILLILTLFFWLVFDNKLILMKHVILSLSKGAMVRQAHHDKLKFLNGKLYKHFNIGNLKSARKLSVIWMLLLAFIIWLIISAIVNNNYIEISAFYILKIIELSLLIIYIYFNLRNKKRLITSLFVISLAGFFQGLIAIYQFVYQCPLFKHPFLHKLTGESTVYPHLPGIAKIVVDNEKFIRAYGTFPHPNLLGGFLIISISISIYLLLKHKSYILSRLSFKYNNINTNKSQVRASSLLLSLFWIIFIFTQITALLFTFSRTAWMGFLLSLFMITVLYFYNRKIVSRETISMDLNDRRPKFSINNSDSSVSAKEQNCYCRLFYRFKELVVIVLLTLILTIIYFPHINSRINEGLLANSFSSSDYLPSNYAVDDRIFYNNVSRETISENCIFGSGPGTFIFQINGHLTKNNIDQKPEPWQYQPAHNIYLLIISEIGIVGFIILALFIMKIVIYNFRIIKKPLNKRFSLDNNSNNIPIVSRETIGSAETNKRTKNILNYRTAKFVMVNLSNYDKFSVLPTLRQAQGDISKIFNNKRFRQKLNNKIVSRETISIDLNQELNCYLLAILVSFLFIGLFDHYFWTLQQGKLMFWLVLGLMLASNNVISKEDKY